MIACACGCSEPFVPVDSRGRPRRFIYGHWPRTQERAAPVDRFMSKLMPEPMTGCWLWLGRRMPGGYGSFWPGGHKGVEGGDVPAHRWAYEHFVGPLGELQALHRCDTPACVNPAHLFAGTQLDNVRDCIAKGRRFNQQRR